MIRRNMGNVPDVHHPGQGHRRAALDRVASDKPRKIRMPRYLVERSFPDGLAIPMNDTGAGACNGVIARNAEKGVTWVQSYVSPDKKKTFCIYDGPSPEAIRSVAQKNSLPVDTITEVRVLDPYFYH
jgi:Protein of unknown function (DUF4242)